MIQINKNTITKYNKIAKKRMIEIIQEKLIPNTKYFIEILPHHESVACSRFIGTFIENINPEGLVISCFVNVNKVNKDYHLMQKGRNLRPVNPTNNAYTWHYYQVSKPIFEINKDKRIMQAGFDKFLVGITGDSHFKGGEYLGEQQFTRRGMKGQHPIISQSDIALYKKFIKNKK